MIKNIILLFSFLISNILPQNILTPIEKSNFTKLTSHAELKQFISEVDKTSDLIKIEVLTKSIEGKELYAVYFSKDGFGKDKLKIKVLIFAQQHGNEHSGKEAALLLINELLKPENQYLFDKIDFVLIPQMNPDGSEKNQRRNGNNMDLNRNHLILTEPETIALHKLFNKYHFDVTMDVHEYWPFGEEWKKLGFRRNFDVTVGAVTNTNISDKIKKLSYEKYLQFAFDFINRQGYTAFHYITGGPVGVDYLRYSTFDINDGRQSFGIQNTLSFIQEGMNGENYSTDNIERRAKSQMYGMLALLKFSYENKEQIKNIIAEERKKLIDNKGEAKVAIQLDHFSDGNDLKMELLSYYSGKDTIVTASDFRSVVKSICDVKRPKGYLIPKNLKEFVDWADRQELIYSNYKKSDEDKIEQYFIARIDSMDFERDTIINPIVEVKTIKNDLCADDYIFIPVNQLRNNMIVIALEPKSELGLVTYKQFEHLLKKEETYPILRVVN